jgi:hypothetical protein
MWVTSERELDDVGGQSCGEVKNVSVDAGKANNFKISNQKYS